MYLPHVRGTHPLTDMYVGRVRSIRLGQASLLIRLECLLLRYYPYDDLPTHTPEYMGTRPDIWASYTPCTLCMPFASQSAWAHDDETRASPCTPHTRVSAAPAAKRSVLPGSGHVSRYGHHIRPVRYVCPMRPGQRGLTTTRPGPLGGLV